MIEIFQNIVRHSEEQNKNDYFGVRSLEESIHIFSSNEIGLKAYEFLNFKIEQTYFNKFHIQIILSYYV